MRRLFATVLVLVGCSSVDAGPMDAGPVLRIPVEIASANGAVFFQAEVADTPSERARGLMHREQMAAEHGMLFLFPEPDQLSFWMKNTLIPLDMIFIRADRTILGIVENAEPKTLTGRSVRGDSQFVLEINGGLSRTLGLGPDQKVTFMAPLPSE